MKRSNNTFKIKIKNMLYIRTLIIILLSLLLLNACTTIMKRRYQKGYYVDWLTNKKFNTKKPDSLSSKLVTKTFLNSNDTDIQNDTIQANTLQAFNNEAKYIPKINNYVHKQSQYFNSTQGDKNNTISTNVVTEKIKSNKIIHKRFKPMDIEKLRELWARCDLSYDTVLKLVLLFGIMGAHYWYARKYVIGCLNTFVFLGTLTGIWMTILQPIGIIVLLFYGIPNIIWWRIDVNRVKDGSFKPECNLEYTVPAQQNTPSSEPNTKNYTSESKRIVAFGTGFFITNNILVTNYHVIENGYYPFIYDKNTGKQYPLFVIAKDISNDLAILKSPEFEVSDIPYCISKSDVRVGDEVFTIGYPEAQYLGIEPKFADGKVSSLTGYKDDASKYQLTVPVHPGNSGSALFNKDGEIIGVLNAKFTKGENVSYAVKKEALINLLKLNNIQIPEVSKLSNLPLQDKIENIKKYIYIIVLKE